MEKMHILEQFEHYLMGQKSRHYTNFRLLVENPRPIPEHTDFFEAMETELKQLAYYNELIAAIPRDLEE